MTTPIDWNAAYRHSDTLRRVGPVIAQAVRDLESASTSFDELFVGLQSRDEYIGHLEQRLAEARGWTAPPATVIGTLAALESAGARVVRIQFFKVEGVAAVSIVWPGDVTPTEHRCPDDGGQAGFAAELRAYAASLNETAGS